MGRSRKVHFGYSNNEKCFLSRTTARGRREAARLCLLSRSSCRNATTELAPARAASRAAAVGVDGIHIDAEFHGQLHCFKSEGFAERSTSTHGDPPPPMPEAAITAVNVSRRCWYARGPDLSE